MKKVPEDLAAKLYSVSDRFLDQGAEDAGIPRATLYYFSGKDDLVTLFMQEKMERVATLVQKAKAGEGTALERFEAAMRASPRWPATPRSA
jgi:AcrR family transcriptional regulator